MLKNLKDQIQPCLGDLVVLQIKLGLYITPQCVSTSWAHLDVVQNQNKIKETSSLAREIVSERSKALNLIPSISCHSFPALLVMVLVASEHTSDTYKNNLSGHHTQLAWYRWTFLMYYITIWSSITLRWVSFPLWEHHFSTPNHSPTKIPIATAVFLCIG